MDKCIIYLCLCGIKHGNYGTNSQNDQNQKYTGKELEHINLTYGSINNSACN